MPQTSQSFWVTLPGVLTGVAALITALVGAAAFVVTSGRSNPSTTPTPTSPPPVSTEPTSPTVPTTFTTSATAALLEDLPADIDPDSCRDLTSAPHWSAAGAVAYIQCGGSSSNKGPTISFFYRFTSRGELAESFRADASEYGLTPFADPSYDCPDYLGHRTWQHGSNTGEVGCLVDYSTQTAYVLWTQHNALAKAYVGMPLTAHGGLQTLWAWWNDPANSDMQVG